VLYTGVTNNLCTRLQQHYENRDQQKTFAGRYHCYKLLYYERFTYIIHAIEREKEIKNLGRAKKEALINEVNPKWDFLIVDD
jgi:putative endonuclease